MKFIAQYSARICGTHHGETVDFVGLDSNNFAVFKREDNGEFHLILIERVDYNSEDLDEVLNNPGGYRSEQLLPMWRSNIVKEPKFMDVRYYTDILALNSKYLDVNDNHVRTVNKLLDELKEYLNKEGFGLVIAKNRGF